MRQKKYGLDKISLTSSKGSATKLLDWGCSLSSSRVPPVDVLVDTSGEKRCQAEEGGLLSNVQKGVS